MTENEQYQLRYLVMPDMLVRDKRLTLMELKIACFIHTFKGERFYFSNEHLGRMLGSEPKSISRSIQGLVKKGLIGVSYEVKAGGGKVRFIRSNIKEELEGKTKKPNLPKVGFRVYPNEDSDSTQNGIPINKEVNGNKLNGTEKGKQPQSSKTALIACTEDELKAIAKNTQADLSDVRAIHAEIMDKIADGIFQEKKYGKTVYFTVSNWTRKALLTGRIQKKERLHII